MGTRTPVMAHAADLLSRATARELAEFAGVITPALERDCLRSAGRLNAIQRKALAAVTPGAAIRLLVSGGTLAGFFEQVEYNGRRLAKLDLPPAAVLPALRRYARSLEKQAGTARARAAFEQLNFATMLTLSNAYHEVAETEAAVFSGLARAELEARSAAELLHGAVEVLLPYCRADEARVWAFEDSSAWLASSIPGGSARYGERVPVARRAGLLRPRYAGGGDNLIALDPSWRGSCWSIPVGKVAVLQFGFARQYPWMPREVRVLTSAADHILLAWEKQRLATDLAAREQRLRELSGHIADAAEQERRRIGRELHDETGQVLLYLGLKLEMLEKSAPRELRPALAEVRGVTGDVVAGLRRIIADLTPAVLESAGLAAALRQLVNRFRRVQDMAVHLELRRVGRLPERAALLVYRLVQECLSNAARHSSASELKISLRCADERLKFTFQDNGAGFNVAEAERKPGSFGLAGMKERVTLCGGSFSIRSKPGRGTTIEAGIPTAEPTAAVGSHF